jgi:predicted enzyme related to lactoylglutathione lyase
MLQGLRTVIYKVDDLDDAKAWYSALLGIEPYFDQPFYVGYNVGGYELGLDPDMTDSIRGTSPATYWGVADIAAAIENLRAKATEIVSDIQDVGSGIKVATIEDPFGNQIGLIENPHFKIAD